MTSPTMNIIKLLALFVMIATASLSQAQESKAPAGGTKVVFEVTMEGPEQWTAVLNNVENLRTALGAATEIEVVAHSKGLGMLVAKDNGLTDRMKKLADDGVVFAACENTMKKKDATKDQLVPFAKTTDSGVAEVIRKQEAGWSYIKSGI